MKPIRSTLELVVTQWGVIPVREIRINGLTVPEWIVRRTRLKAPLPAMVSPIGWLDLFDKSSHERLYPDGPADFPDGRRAVLVCRHCGGLGCGAMSVRIEDRIATIRWHDWLWQNDRDDAESDDFDGKMPELEFERDAYFAVLRSAFS